jgi:hypothetical protein
MNTMEDEINKAPQTPKDPEKDKPAADQKSVI